MSESFHEAGARLSHAIDKLRDALWEPFAPYAQRLIKWLRKESS